MSLWCRLCLKIFLPRWYSCSCCNFQNTSGWLLSLFFPWSLAFTWTSTFALLWKWYSLYYYKQVVIKNWPANKGKKAPITSFPPLPPFSWKPHILLSTCLLSQKTKLSEVSFLLCLACLSHHVSPRAVALLEFEWQNLNHVFCDPDLGLKALEIRDEYSYLLKTGILWGNAEINTENFIPILYYKFVFIFIYIII